MSDPDPDLDPELQDRAVRATRVRTLRRRHRLTQRALAAAAGISLGALQSLETGQHETRDETLVKVAAALTVAPEWLLRPSEPQRQYIDPFAGTGVALPPALLAMEKLAAAFELNVEDLLFARAHNRATSDVRQRVQHMLDPAESFVVMFDSTTAPIGRLLLPVLEQLRRLDGERRASLLHAIVVSLETTLASSSPESAQTVAPAPSARRLG